MRKTIPGIIVASILASVFAASAADPSLIDAVRRRDQRLVAALLKTKVDVNIRRGDGSTALSWAVFQGESAIAEMLLQAGANVNTRTDDGESPVSLAAANGDPKLIGLFLEAGGDPNGVKWDGESVLMTAVGAKCLECVRLLIAKGATVDGTDADAGQTALMWAAADGFAAAVDLLIRSGASVNKASKGGFTPLVFAAIQNDAQSIRLLQSAGAQVDAKLPNGLTPLAVAISYGNVTAASALIDAGADPAVNAGRSGYTPLHMAAAAGSLDLVRTLIARHVDLNARSAPAAGGAANAPDRLPTLGEATPLLLAAQNNRVDVMRELIHAGANPALKASDGTTLLAAAASSGQLEAVQCAYEFDNDVKVKITGGGRAGAARAGRTGANSQAPAGGETLVSLAVAAAHRGVPEQRICDTLRWLAAKGAPLNEVRRAFGGSAGSTALSLASQGGYTEIAGVLQKLIEGSTAKPE